MEKSVDVFDLLNLGSRLAEHRVGEFLRTGRETAVVKTEYGKVKGVKRSTIYGDEYFGFEKIPYAQPPIDNLRFKAPKPPLPWEDVLDCTRGNVAPLQSILYNIKTGSEDCLYLNVYTKNVEPKKPRAVMIWIYGGYYAIGEATRDFYSPDLLMKKNIVLVTINYRLGPLGFLSLSDPELDIPGNAGLKDQVLAIKWVKQNCAGFGGDPNNITVFGESAGAVCTNYMCITDQTKDLFHRAIMMSGCVQNSWVPKGKTENAYRVAKAVGYTGENNEKDILEFLLKAKGRDLFGWDQMLVKKQYIGVYPFGPVVEPYITKECVIPKSPHKMIKTAWGNKIPIMVGCTSFEGLTFYPNYKNHKDLLDSLETCTIFIPGGLVTDRESSEAFEMGQTIKKAHFDEKSSDRLTAALDILSFQHFIDPMNRFILSRHKYSDAPTYLYRFDFESINLVSPNYVLRAGKDVHGVSHTDDLAYLFNSFMGRKVNTKSREYKTIEWMTALWTFFAKTGNPNSAITKWVKWNPTTKEDKTHVCLNISDKLIIQSWPEMEKAKVWESLFPKKK